MHKQVKKIAEWFSRARLLQFVLVFSLLLLASAIYRFVAQNNWLENEFAAQVQNIQLNEEIAELSLYIKNAESAVRGYIISGNPEYISNFDASIDSIRTIYFTIQQLENRNTENADDALFLKSDRLIQEKTEHMKQLKLLCDNHQYKMAADLISTNKGLHLADSIAVINTQISINIHTRLQKSQSGFLKVHSNNNNLAYTGSSIALLLIVLSIYLLMTEIRKTKKISRELLVKNQFYQTTLSSLSEGLITTDKEGNIEYINAAAEQLTGWRWQDAKKQPLHRVFNVVNEETGQPFDHIVSRILKSGKTIGLENNTILHAKDAGTFIISNNGSPIFDVNGKISGAVLVFNDITEKHRIVKQLRDSEEKYRNLVEQASDAILIYSFDGTIDEFNKTCYTMLGYSKEEYAKLRLTDILVDEIITNQDTYTAILAGEIKTLESKLMRKDGSLLETEITVKLLADGKAIAFARDITERKKAEEALQESEETFRRLFTESADPILLLDDSGFTECNQAAASILGYSSPQEVLIMQPWEISPEKQTDGRLSTEKAAAMIAIALQQGNNRFEWIHTKKDGTEFPVEVMLTPIILKGKQLFYTIWRDITERKKAELALKESETFNRSILTSIDYHIAVVEANGNIISVNKAWNDFSIKNEETVLERTGIGSNYIAVCEKSAEAGDMIAAKSLQGFKQVLNKEIPFFEMEYPCHSVDEQRWFLLRIVNFSDDSPKVVMMHIDISEIKKTEKELLTSNIRLEHAEEQANIGSWQRDMISNKRYWSKNMFRLFGLEPAENPPGLDQYLECIHPDDRESAENKLVKISQGHELPDYEYRTNPANGPVRNLYITLFYEKDAEGIIIKYNGCILDITERKIAEKEIRDYKLALDESSLVDVSDSNGIISYVNENFCRLSKYSKKELIGKSHRILNSGYHPKELFQHLWNTVNKGKIWRNEIKDRAKDGSFYWVDTTIVPFLDTDGKPFQFITIRTDITKRKNAEARMTEAVERYDILAEATSDTIWDWDIVNNKMLYNEGITKMFGYKASEVGNVVEWWNKKLHSEDFQHVKDALEDVFEKKLERLQLQYRFRCADGAYKNIFDRAFVIYGEAGNPIRMIGAMQDITHEVQEEIRIAKAIIDAQEQERNYLGAELHDNINQILAGTMLTLGIVKSNELDAAQRTGFINSAMAYLTDAIKETRKLSHSLAPASFEENSLKDMFENLLLTINVENLFKVSFHFDDLKEPVIPENIQVNLYRILQEQTKNILKYSEANIIEVGVKIIDNAVRLRIYDNGKGFDTKAKKTGIGLSNIKKRAESLSGKFMLNSAPGNGCELIVEIPLDIE